MARGIKLSNQGKEYMNIQRQKKGFSKYDIEWSILASTSESTLKRFWAGENITPENFREICRVVDIDLAKEWDRLVEQNEKDSTRVKALKDLNDIHTFTSKTSITEFKVTIRGISIFDEYNTQLLGNSLEDLKDFLDKSYIQFPASPMQLDSEAKFTINVNGIGFLDEDTQLIVQNILSEIEYLLVRSHIKIIPIQLKS